MTPTIGRIVVYKLSKRDAEQINKRRNDAHKHLDEHRAASNGVQIHYGWNVAEGNEFPAVVVHGHGETCASLTVFAAGSDNFWAPSMNLGDEPGTWHWPVWE